MLRQVQRVRTVMLSAMHLALRGLLQKAALWKKADRIALLQEKRLRKLVTHAKACSPFYADLYQRIDPARCPLTDLPTTSKPVMMANFDQFLTDRQVKLAELEEFVSDPGRLGQWYRGKYAISRTSGTGGLQAIIVQDRAMMELLFALQMLRGSRLTRSPLAILQRLFRRTRLAVVTIGQGFFPSASALAYEPAGAEFFINKLWIQQIEPLEEVTARLNDFQPEVLLGYANVLEMLAREELEGRLRIGQQRTLRQIINMSEPLSAGARSLVEKAFGIMVTNNYAMGECMALTTACPQGHGMHVQADWAILEVVDEELRPVPPGTSGAKVLITNLYNTIQPFIRYEVNDVVTLSPTPCPCGSPLPLILRVEGRTDEVVWIEDDGKFRQIHPYVFVDVLDEFPAVGWYQIVQTERNRFILRAVAAPGRHLTVDEVRQVMERGLRRFGLADKIIMDVELSSDVAPNPKSGKLKRISSQIAPPNIS